MVLLLSVVESVSVAASDAETETEEELACILDFVPSVTVIHAANLVKKSAIYSASVLNVQPHEAREDREAQDHEAQGHVVLDGEAP
jgi:hypothetical protein